MRDKFYFEYFQEGKKKFVYLRKCQLFNKQTNFNPKLKLTRQDDVIVIEDDVINLDDSDCEFVKRKKVLPANVAGKKNNIKKYIKN